MDWSLRRCARTGHLTFKPDNEIWAASKSIVPNALSMPSSLQQVVILELNLILKAPPLNFIPQWTSPVFSAVHRFHLPRNDALNANATFSGQLTSRTASHLPKVLVRHFRAISQMEERHKLNNWPLGWLLWRQQLDVCGNPSLYLRQILGLKLFSVDNQSLQNPLAPYRP